MNNSDDVEGWLSLHPADYWVFDKLILSRKLNYVCGPSGMPVPTPGVYMVRPIMNMYGMSLNARFESLSGSTHHLHPGEFWCEKFEGDHISVDYLNQTPVLTVKGERNSEDPVYKWDRWTKIDHCIEYPDVLRDLHRHYERVNCEFIGGKLIEVHFRHNPDFRFGNTEAIPVWDATDGTERDGYTFVSDPDYKRLGFFIR